MTGDFELMAKGICPVCHMHRSRHSQKKANICLNIMRKRHGIKKPQVEVDGKLYDVNLSLGEKQND